LIAGRKVPLNNKTIRENVCFSFFIKNWVFHKYVIEICQGFAITSGVRVSSEIAVNSIRSVRERILWRVDLLI